MNTTTPEGSFAIISFWTLTVNVLASSILDITIINQISNCQTKKYDMERCKELVSVQCALLITATGPLCCLHDILE